MRAVTDLRKRDLGAPIETPDRPDLIRVSMPPSDPIPPLSAMHARWVELKRPRTQKQIDDNARYLRLFVSLHGDLPVDQITGKHIRAFRDRLVCCPRNSPDALATAPLEDLLGFALAHPEKPQLGRGTINNKAPGAISALLTAAIQDELIDRNPVRGQKLDLKEHDTVERQPHTIVELTAIFGTTVYDASPQIPRGGKGMAAWFLPLLGLFVGGRLEELGQLLVADVRAEDDIPFILITEVPENGVQVITKAVKTPASRRPVPLHAALIRLGFLDYVAHLKAIGQERLFPELQSYRGRWTKDWSKWWGRWLDKNVTCDKRKCFHSLRHNLIAELRRLKVPAEIIKALIGHSARDVTSRYDRKDGQLYDLMTLNSEIQRVQFVGLDLTKLERRQPWRSNAG